MVAGLVGWLKSVVTNLSAHIVVAIIAMAAKVKSVSSSFLSLSLTKIEFLYQQSVEH